MAADFSEYKTGNGYEKSELSAAGLDNLRLSISAVQ